MAKAATGQPMRSAERLLDVLGSFSEDHPERTIMEISRELELAPSTVRRILMILAGRGYVRQDPETKRFRLHLRLLRLAATAQASFDLVRLAAPVLDRLRGETDETIQLSVLDGTDLVQVDNRPSKRAIRIFHPVGHRIRPYAGSAQGKVLLADLSEEALAALLPAEGSWPPATGKTITEAHALEEHLKKVREQGYAINDGESEEDVWAVSVPVRDHTGRVIAALNIACLRSRTTRPRERVLIAAAKEAGRELSSILHYDAP